MPAADTSTLAWIAWALQGAVVFAALMAAVLRRDWWPFSHYPMFAGVAEAKGVRYFRARFSLRDGRRLGLAGLADAIADPFHRRCEEIFPEDGQPDLFAARAAMLSLWREARALDPALADAIAVEIVVRTASVEPDGSIRQSETPVHALNLESGRAEP